MAFNAVTRITIQVTPVYTDPSVRILFMTTNSKLTMFDQHSDISLSSGSSSKVKELLYSVEMRQFIGYKLKKLCVV